MEPVPAPEPSPQPSPGPRPAQLSVYIATSVDGFIARRDHGLDWLERVAVRGQDYGYASFMDTVDVVVLGRRTYDVVLELGAWPFTGKRVIVLTHRELAPNADVESFAGSPDGLVARLTSTGATRVYLDGGTVVQQFLRAGLVDDVTLSVIPIVLGSGIRLWSDDGRETALDLENVEAFPSGLVQLRYRTRPPSQ